MTENPHLQNIIKKVTSDFASTVKNEEVPLNLLLKGHLFIENLLEEVLAAFDVKGNLNRKSFYEKTRSLSEIGTKEEHIKVQIAAITPLLYAINEARNNLAHNLHFEVNEGAVNKIGILMGSEFILNKYEVGHNNVTENLLFCLNEIVVELGGIIYMRVENLKNSIKTTKAPTKMSADQTSTSTPHSIQSPKHDQNKKN